MELLSFLLIVKRDTNSVGKIIMACRYCSTHISVLGDLPISKQRFFNTQSEPKIVVFKSSCCVSGSGVRGLSADLFLN